jgi:hypothetical protein
MGLWILSCLLVFLVMPFLLEILKILKLLMSLESPILLEILKTLEFLKSLPRQH